jgi:hypothetical protein
MISTGEPQMRGIACMLIAIALLSTMDASAKWLMSGGMSAIIASGLYIVHRERISHEAHRKTF